MEAAPAGAPLRPLWRLFRGWSLLVMVVLAGCRQVGNEEGGAGGDSRTALPLPKAVAGTLASPPIPSDSTAEPSEPREMYFDLTEFDWYRRGQPLVHDSARYLPAGGPVPVEADSLKLAGTYEGVRYYARPAAGGGDTLFVPVYPRYWLPFAPQRRREGG